MRMKPLASLAPVVLLTLLVAACASKPLPLPPERPAPPPPATAPTPTPTPTPTYSNWMDAPQTPGDWKYAASGSVTMASFVGPSMEARFRMTCEPATRQVRLMRPGSSPVPVPMRVRTETAERLLTAVTIPGHVPTLAAALPGRDSFLDAIAFSKGRFAVETEGMPTLYLPAWPEISRVIEDCR